MPKGTFLAEVKQQQKNQAKGLTHHQVLRLTEGIRQSVSTKF